MSYLRPYLFLLDVRLHSIPRFKIRLIKRFKPTVGVETTKHSFFLLFFFFLEFVLSCESLHTGLWFLILYIMLFFR